jgi:L-ascorbate metabolism protein UlaG (beta-lactamase superfamily)
MRRWRRRIGLGLVGIFAGAITLGLCLGWTAFGRRAEGERRARMERSPEWHGGQFHNPQPLVNHFWLGMRRMFGASDYSAPAGPVPTVRSRYETPPPSGLRVTWLGHSTTLLEIDGQRILTDPIWSERAGPLPWPGPVRWFAPPIPLDELPPIDAVLISHDHYDHLDFPTVKALAARGVSFVVPLGVGAHLQYWGVAPSKIVELDWWERARVGTLELTCTPARHASGRTAFDQDAKLWAGYALVGARHRVYYSGDTGIFPAMREIGRRLGPFDLTMIEIGQYDPSWPDWHIGPEQAVRAHQLVGGRVMLPVHWGLFRLAYHGWTEPIERALAAAAKDGVTLIAPRPGQSVEPSSPPPFDHWWPSLPFSNTPIVSTQMD